MCLFENFPMFNKSNVKGNLGGDFPAKGRWRLMILAKNRATVLCVEIASGSDQ
jgi:hypothetical protein